MSIGFTTSESASRKTTFSYSLELPQFELAEIVDRIVEGRLVALVEGRGAMQRLAAVALLNASETCGWLHRHDAAAFPLELVEMLRLVRSPARRAGAVVPVQRSERASASAPRPYSSLVTSVAKARRAGARETGIRVAAGGFSIGPSPSRRIECLRLTGCRADMRHCHGESVTVAGPAGQPPAFGRARFARVSGGSFSSAS